MADASLDVFFAKKDKSKKSKSRKFANADPVGKAQDDGGGGKMSEKPKREKEKVTNSSTGSTLLQNIIQGDDEWKDIEEKETDYTGLKIQNVQISELRDEDYERSKCDETQEDEQSRNKDGQGPWNRGAVEPATEQLPAEAPPAAAPAAKKDTKYVAPGMRENATPLPSTKAKPKSAPQLSSEFDFPSLSAASEVKPAKKIELAEQSKGKLSSQSSDLSNLRRPYAELASKSEMANQADSS